MTCKQVTVLIIIIIIWISVVGAPLKKVGIPVSRDGCCRRPSFHDHGIVLIRDVGPVNSTSTLFHLSSTFLLSCYPLAQNVLNFHTRAVLFCASSNYHTLNPHANKHGSNC